MNISPELTFRSRGQNYVISGLDTEDLAFVFVEEELGRFDWQGNWKKVKENGTARQRIATWLEAMDIDSVQPEEIIQVLDKLATERPGRWL